MYPSIPVSLMSMYLLRIMSHREFLNANTNILKMTKEWIPEYSYRFQLENALVLNLAV